MCKNTKVFGNYDRRVVDLPGSTLELPFPAIFYFSVGYLRVHRTLSPVLSLLGAFLVGASPSKLYVLRILPPRMLPLGGVATMSSWAPGRPITLAGASIAHAHSPSQPVFRV